MQTSGVLLIDRDESTRTLLHPHLNVVGLALSCAADDRDAFTVVQRERNIGLVLRHWVITTLDSSRGGTLIHRYTADGVLDREIRLAGRIKALGFTGPDRMLALVARDDDHGLDVLRTYETAAFAR